jgi:drug/metabolite transporter (DMT)-like permease
VSLAADIGDPPHVGLNFRARSSSLTSLSANQRGIVAIVACMAAYTVNDVLVKEIIRDYPLGQVIFFRGLITCALIGSAAWLLGHGRKIWSAISVPLSWRTLVDGLSTATFIAALAQMRLAEVAAVLQLAPLMITALSVLIYGEIVGWRRWTAISVGFLGTLLIIKPTTSGLDVWAVVAAASALTAAIRELLTRRINPDIPTFVIAFWGAVGITFFGALGAFVEEWRMFEVRDLGMLTAAGIFVATAIYLLAFAYRGVELSVVAPFRYIYLLTSAIGGYLMFNEVPDVWSVVGAAMIVGSGLYALHRERLRKRELTAKAETAL